MTWCQRGRTDLINAMTSEVITARLFFRHDGVMTAQTFSDYLRQWRHTRRYSQLALSLQADLSQRHLSCLESGRAQPSRAMVLKLAQALALSLRETNELLEAAGFVAQFREDTWQSPALAPVKQALELMLQHHEPLPALVMNRRWELLMANEAIARLLQACQIDAGIWSRLCPDEPPNLLLLTLHPDGLGGFLENRDEVAHHVAQRVQRDGLDCPRLAPWLPSGDTLALRPPTLPVLPMKLRIGDVRLQLFTLLASVGTPQDVTTDEVRVELFFPLDEATRAWFSDPMSPALGASHPAECPSPPPHSATRPHQSTESSAAE